MTAPGKMLRAGLELSGLFEARCPQIHMRAVNRAPAKLDSSAGYVSLRHHERLNTRQKRGCTDGVYGPAKLRQLTPRPIRELAIDQATRPQRLDVLQRSEVGHFDLDHHVGSLGPTAPDSALSVYDASEPSCVCIFHRVNTLQVKRCGPGLSGVSFHAAAALSPYPVARGKARKCRFPQDISRSFCYVLTGCWGLSRDHSGGYKPRAGGRVSATPRACSSVTGSNLRHHPSSHVVESGRG
jgi:hypothetical protein